VKIPEGVSRLAALVCVPVELLEDSPLEPELIPVELLIRLLDDTRDDDGELVGEEAGEELLGDPPLELELIPVELLIRLLDDTRDDDGELEVGDELLDDPPPVVDKETMRP